MAPLMTEDSICVSEVKATFSATWAQMVNRLFAKKINAQGGTDRDPMLAGRRNGYR